MKSSLELVFFQYQQNQASLGVMMDMKGMERDYDNKLLLLCRSNVGNPAFNLP